jgi:hypothetical protein
MCRVFLVYTTRYKKVSVFDYPCTFDKGWQKKLILNWVKSLVSDNTYYVDQRYFFPLHYFFSSNWSHDKHKLQLKTDLSSENQDNGNAPNLAGFFNVANMDIKTFTRVIAGNQTTFIRRKGQWATQTILQLEDINLLRRYPYIFLRLTPGLLIYARCKHIKIPKCVKLFTYIVCD